MSSSNLLALPSHTLFAPSSFEKIGEDYIVTPGKVKSCCIAPSIDTLEFTRSL